MYRFPPAAGPAPAPKISTGSRFILIALVFLYLELLIVLAARGQYVIVWKTCVIPVLFLAAAAQRSAGVFAREWMAFLGFTILFDSVRGFIFALITAWDMPVYMNGVIGLEKVVLGGRLMPAILQHAFFRAGTVTALEKLATIFHGSHFLFFLLFGMMLWVLRRAEFRRYATAMLLLMYTGLLCYLLYPCVPPWMAAHTFEVIAPVFRIRDLIYNAALPTLQGALDTNPVAAMPSLHAGFPMLCALVGLQVFGRRALPAVAYALLVAFSVMYLGDHYLVDVLAGWLLAGVVFLLVYRTPCMGWLESRWRQWLKPTGQLLPLVAASVLALLATLAVGRLTDRLSRPYIPSRGFINAELGGRSPVTGFFRGIRAYRDGDPVSAQRILATSLKAITRPRMRATALLLVGKSAYRNGDFAASAAALRQLERSLLDREAAEILAAVQADGPTVQHERAPASHPIDTAVREAEWIGTE